MNGIGIPNTHNFNLIRQDKHNGKIKEYARRARPKPNCLMADFNATFIQQNLHIPQRKREPQIHHHRQADDFRRRLEVPKKAS